MSARDQLAEDLRCLGTSGDLDVSRSGCASGMISPHRDETSIEMSVTAPLMRKPSCLIFVNAAAPAGGLVVGRGRQGSMKVASWGNGR
jgi:hypothetical protein